MIDVLMPYFGDAQLARSAIESVFAQTSLDWRLVVVDDAAPDPAIGRWLRSLDHDKVRYYRNDSNLGINGNFRRCLSYAKAPYVTFLGCDDILGPDYVALMHQAIRRHDEPAMIQPRVGVVDENGDRCMTLVDAVKSLLAPSGGDRVVAGERAAVRLLHGAWTYFPAICWRRDALASHPFRPGLETTLDLRLILDLLVDGEVLVRLDEVAFQYRRHRRSASMTRAISSTRFDEEAALFDELAAFFEARGWRKASRAARLHLTSRLYAGINLGVALRDRQPTVARRLLRHAVGWRPSLENDDLGRSVLPPSASEV